jgi:hypothetical protein
LSSSHAVHRDRRRRLHARQNSTRVHECVDFRETAPAAAYQDMFNDDEDVSLEGGLARQDKLLDVEEWRANIPKWNSRSLARSRMPA